MMKYIAFGMIFSLALDATIIRLLLVPAVMHLLRDDNWWAPRWVKRAYASLGEGDESSAGTAGSQPTPAAPAQPADDPETHPGRAGVSVEENHELVPFRELMRQLEERKALEYTQKRELER